MSEGEITLASTTASQAEMDHALGEDWEKPFIEPAPAAEPAAPAENPEPGKEDAAPETDDAPVVEKPGNWQKRVDKLTRRSHEQQAEIERLQSLVAGAKTPTPTPAPAGKPKPDDPQFATYEDYVEALTDWKVAQKLEADKAAITKEGEQERAKTVMADYNRKLDATRAAHADYDDVMEGIESGNVQIPAALQPAILESENGPEIAYHLGKHPEEAQKLCGMSLARAAVEIGRISARIEAGASPAPAKSKPAATAAPAPITPVAQRGGAQKSPLWEAPFQEWKRRYDAGER